MTNWKQELINELSYQENFRTMTDEEVINRAISQLLDEVDQIIGDDIDIDMAINPKQNGAGPSIAFPGNDLNEVTVRELSGMNKLKSKQRQALSSLRTKLLGDV